MKPKMIILVISLACFINCGRSSSELQNYPDPYAEAFWNKQIKIMTSYDPYDSSFVDPSRVETLIFDKVGNIIQRRAFMTNDTMTYDDKHFLTRWWQRLEAPVNSIITYAKDSTGRLIQVWHNSRARTWNYTREEFSAAGKDTVVFELDHKGRVVKAVDVEKTTIYHYSGSKLVRKEIYIKNGNDQPSYVTLYHYNIAIKKIEHFTRGILDETHYYSRAGLLDSTVHQFQGKHTIKKYRYEFY
ncbi:MAG TPA: hypothetical protein VGD65_17760 [Chryseosolibacter sp.]